MSDDIFNTQSIRQRVRVLIIIKAEMILPGMDVVVRQYPADGGDRKTLGRKFLQDCFDYLTPIDASKEGVELAPGVPAFNNISPRGGNFGK